MDNQALNKHEHFIVGSVYRPKKDFKPTSWGKEMPYIKKGEMMVCVRYESVDRTYVVFKHKHGEFWSPQKRLKSIYDWNFSIDESPEAFAFSLSVL